MSFISLARFSAVYILENADHEIIKRGKNYYRSWGRCRLKSLNTETASYIVRGTRDYNVRIFIESGEFRADCDCPYTDEVTEIICKHKVAAALHLEEHLRNRPLPAGRSFHIICRPITFRRKSGTIPLRFRKFCSMKS
jgi:uncharacterized Zn finger protein